MQDNLNGRADRDGLWIEPQKRSEAGTSRNPRGMSAPELTQESSAFMRRRMSIDETFIAKAIWECLKNNDPEGVVEIIETHLEIVNKVEASQEGV